MDLDSVADELYGLPLEEFTSTRNARAKQARKEGDRELATDIQRLSKPTTAAWLVNQLSRELADQLRPLIDLGRDLREATSTLSGDELRTLTRQRHEVVHALVQQARRLGSDGGQRVSDDVAAEVQRTLEASLADPDVAEAVLAGRLSRPAEYAGFGVPAGVEPREPGQPAGSRAASRATAEVTDLAERRRAAAEREEREAARRMEAARDAHQQAEAEQSKASEAVTAARREVEDLRAALDRAEQRMQEAEEADRSARDRVRRAAEEVESAEQRHTDAEAALRDTTP